MPLSVDTLQFDVLAADPSTPIEGEMWYNTTEKVFKTYQGGSIQTSTGKNKFDAIIAPSITDDSSAGYSIGSRWINTAADEEYVCLDSTVSAAVWKGTTTGGSGASSVPSGAFLTLDGSAGEDGPMGPPGQTGPQGSQGVPGTTGAQGPLGPPVFLVGDSGEDGQNGPPGLTGATGAPGTTGEQGPAGPPVFLVGDSGEDGQDGRPGAPGVDGAAGSTGAQGSIGPPIFLVGEAGEDGEVGPPGPIGATGPQGPAGTGGGGGSSGAHLTVDADGAYDEAPFPGIPTHGKHWPWNGRKVLTVDSSGTADFTTIGAAIADALSGDVILIAPGAYPEQITIDKVLAIVGLVPTNYSWDSSAIVINPTITLGQAAITLTSNAGLSVFQNLRVASQHQTGAVDSYGVLIQSMAGSTTYWDNCVIGPEIVTGASPTTRVRSLWVQTNAIADFRDCQLAVDDPSNIATEVPPVVIIGTATVRLLNSRVKSGINTPGDVSIQDTAKLELVASIIEGTLDEGGTNNTTTYIDAASRINAVSADYTDNDAQTKLVHREYGLVDTGGQKDQYKLNLRNIVGDVSTPGNGDVWYSTVSNRIRVRENGTTKFLRSLWDGGQFVTVDAGGGADYTTIQSAIDAIAADSDITILVAPGTYSELLTLKSGINIKGLGPRPSSVYGATGVVIVNNPTPASSSTLLTYSSATGNPVCLENIQFGLSGSADSGIFYLLNVTGSGGSARTVRFNNCRLTMTYGASTGGATCQLVLQPAGTATVVFDGCGIGVTDIYSNGVWSNSAAFNVNGNAVCIDSIYNSAVALKSFYVPTGGVLDLYDNPKVTRIERAGTGVVSQYGSLGNISVVGDADDGSGTGEITKYEYGHYLTNGTKAAQKLNLRSIAGDIPTPANGNVWFNSTTGKIMVREGGTSHPLCQSCPGMHLTMDGGAGEDGPMGPPGPPGSGSPGAPGAQGPLGAAIFLAAESGEDGIPGPPGSQGPAGSTSAGGSNKQVQYNSSGALAGATKAAINANGSLELLLDAAPATPAADTIGLFGRKIGGRMLPAVIGPSGLDTSLQPNLGRNSVCGAFPNGNSTTITYLRLALTSTGTATSANWASTSLHTSMKRIDYLVTTPSTTAVAGFRGGSQQLWTGNAAGLGGFHFICRWAPATGQSDANSRAWCGLRATTSAPTDVNPSTLLNMIGMGWDSADANVQMMHNDGSGTATKSDLGVSFPVSTSDRAKVYELAMFCAPNSTTIYYEVTDLTTGAVATGSFNTDIPSNTTALNPLGYCSAGGTSSVIGFTLFGLYIETDY